MTRENCLRHKKVLSFRIFGACLILFDSLICPRRLFDIGMRFDMFFQKKLTGYVLIYICKKMVVKLWHK